MTTPAADTRPALMTAYAGAQPFAALRGRTPGRRLGLVVMLVAALGLSACGGGEQAEKFVPSKVISLGDENSLLTDVTVAAGKFSGQKYTVNDAVLFSVKRDATATTTIPDDASVALVSLGAVDTLFNYYPPLEGAGTFGTISITPAANGVGDLVTIPYVNALTLRYISRTVTTPVKLTGASVSLVVESDCTDNRIWIQIVANVYGLGHNSACPRDTRSNAVSYAAVNAEVSDVATQFSANRAQFDARTLVTVLAGQTDVLNAYQANKAGSGAAQLAAENAMEAKGAELGRTINSITDTGARVAFLTLPALQYSPLARADGANAQAFMTRLLTRFNRGLTGINGVRNNGNQNVYVDVYNETRAMAESPGSYNLADAARPWCKRDSGQSGRLPDGTAVPTTAADFVLHCNDLTGPLSGADTIVDPLTYLWADDTHLSPAGHARLGGLASARISENPL